MFLISLSLDSFLSQVQMAAWIYAETQHTHSGYKHTLLWSACTAKSTGCFNPTGNIANCVSHLETYEVLQWQKLNSQPAIFWILTLQIKAVQLILELIIQLCMHIVIPLPCCIFTWIHVCLCFGCRKGWDTSKLIQMGSSWRTASLSFFSPSMPRRSTPEK